MANEVGSQTVRTATPRPLEQRLGIMQGRLVTSHTGELDCPPGPRWREEFAIAAALRLNHIELVAERCLDSTNPIWSATGRGELIAVADADGVNLASLCANESLNTRFDDAEFAQDLSERLAPVVAEIPSAIVILPLLEASDLNALQWSSAASSVSLLAAGLSRHGARLALELGVPASQALRFLGLTTSSDVGVCYDVGNATAFGFDAQAELRVYGDRVWHVHAKDKNLAGQNVRFGTGEVPFAQVLAELTEQRFDGLVTMEATRGDDPVVTATEHRAFLLSLHESARQPTPDAQ